MRHESGKEEENGREESTCVNVKGQVRILLQALPYAILISSLTSIGLFGGYFIGKGLGSYGYIVVLVFSFSFLGFFAGVFISYLIVKVKYPI